MLVAALVALLGLAIVAASARPGDGRAETAIAVPLVAAVAVLAPLVALAVLGGAALAYAASTVVARRTLIYGRRRRAIAGLAGAVVPLGVLLGGAAMDAVPAYPELWIVGAIVPGVLADDVQCQPIDRRGAIAIGGVSTLVALVLSGIVLEGGLEVADPVDLLLAGTGAEDPVSLGWLAAVLLAALTAGTVARWRYGLHVGPVSVPLLAVWSLETPTVPVVYVVAGATGMVAIARVQPRLCLSGRQLSASTGLLGAGIGTVGAVFGGGLPAVVAGALAAEDVRLLRTHAGADLLDALLLGGGMAILVATALVTVGGAPGIVPGVIGGLAAALAIGIGGLVIARRERERPDEEQLRAAERRWVP